MCDFADWFKARAWPERPVSGCGTAVRHFVLPCPRRRRIVVSMAMKLRAVVTLLLCAGWALARWLASVQYGVTVLDPATWTVVAATVVSVAVLASWIPARTAMRVDPAEMLRES